MFRVVPKLEQGDIAPTQVTVPFNKNKQMIQYKGFLKSVYYCRMHVFFFFKGIIPKVNKKYRC